jgi:hypothetical protein
MADARGKTSKYKSLKAMSWIKASRSHLCADESFYVGTEQMFNLCLLLFFLHELSFYIEVFFKGESKEKSLSRRKKLIKFM